MPPDLPIVGGGVFPVRGDHAWATATSPSSSISSVDTNTLLSSLEDASSSSDSEFSSLGGESASESDSDCSSDAFRPPSPPVKTIVIASAGGSNNKAVPSPHSASSVSSSESADYFSAKKVAPKSSFLSRVFPRSKVIDRAVAVKTGVAHWQLAVFDEGLAESERTLYARGAAGFDAMNLRENLVELLDHADEALDCDSVVVVLDKKDPNLASVLHSLMYVGGVVVPSNATSIHKKHSSKFVLVGIAL